MDCFEQMSCFTICSHFHFFYLYFREPIYEEVSFYLFILYCKHGFFEQHVKTGCDIDMGDLVYEPPRDGPTLWEIGIPDRSAAEFYIPDPNSIFINKLFVNHPDRLVHSMCSDLRKYKKETKI